LARTFNPCIAPRGKEWYKEWHKEFGVYRKDLDEFILSKNKN
jgi:hypothetical protein